MRKVALSSLLGTVIEYYDFLLYGTMAALVLGPLFFPTADPAVSAIGAFGALAAGYIARPVGGLIFGHFGDRLGRKSMLVTSMILMGATSTLIGLLPSYDVIGIAAPILLVGLRVLQGLGLGGEYGGAALMVIEHADPRRRGAWVGIMQMGTPLGGLLSTGAVALVTLLPDEQFVSWGWRLPFLLSAALLAVGLWVRLGVSESPLFRQAQEQAAAQRTRNRVPLAELLRRPGLLLTAAGLGIGSFVVTALVSTYSITYGLSIGYDRSDLLRALIFVTLLAIVLLPSLSALTDRIGRKRLMIAGAIAAIVLAFPVYMLFGTGSIPLMTLALLIGVVPQLMMTAPLPSLLAELFGTRVRYTGVSAAYQLASLVGAGFTPLIAASLMAGSVTSVPLSIVMIVGAGITLVCAIRVAETRGRDLREDASDPATPAVSPTADGEAR